MITKSSQFLFENKCLLLHQAKLVWLPFALSLILSLLLFGKGSKIFGKGLNHNYDTKSTDIVLAKLQFQTKDEVFSLHSSLRDNALKHFSIISKAQLDLPKTDLSAF